MYPSKIMTDNSLNGISLNTVAENTNNIDNISVSIMHKILNLNSKFLQMESKYNINNAYNFGFLPYYLAQKLISIWNSDDQTSLNDIIDSIVAEYIINTTNYLCTQNDIYKVKLLLLNILVILTGDDISEDLIGFDNAIKYNTIMQTAYDTFSYIENDSTSYIHIKKVINHVTKILMKDLTMHEMLQNRPDEVKIYVIKMWCFINNISADNIEQYKQDLGQYYDFTKYVVTETESLQDSFDIDNKLISKTFVLDFEELDKIRNQKYILKLPVNPSEELIKLCDTDSFYQIYIYTSFLMYSSNTLIVPSINDYDSGNGRTAEFLASKVYEDISNYFIYSFFNYNTIDYNNEIYIDWCNIKLLANKDTFAYTDKLVVLHIAKFLTKLITSLCPSTFHPSKYDIPKHAFCHFTKDKVWLNLYNIFNIDATYIIIKSNKKYTGVNNTLVDWAQNIQAIFKPLKPLWNYCYDIDNPNKYSKFAMMFVSQFIAKSENCKINNYNVGGDLYTIIDKSFYLIDFKKYELEGYSENYINNTYIKTLVQCWMYMNTYYTYICTLHNNKNQKLILYNNFYVSAINPLHNHMIVSNYKNVDKIITDDIRRKYIFTKSIM